MVDDRKEANIATSLNNPAPVTRPTGPSNSMRKDNPRSVTSVPTKRRRYSSPTTTTFATLVPPIEPTKPKKTKATKSPKTTTKRPLSKRPTAKMTTKSAHKSSTTKKNSMDDLDEFENKHTSKRPSKRPTPTHRKSTRPTSWSRKPSKKATTPKQVLLSTAKVKKTTAFPKPAIATTTTTPLKPTTKSFTKTKVTKKTTPKHPKDEDHEGPVMPPTLTPQHETTKQPAIISPPPLTFKKLHDGMVNQHLEKPEKFINLPDKQDEVLGKVQNNKKTSSSSEFPAEFIVQNPVIIGPKENRTKISTEKPETGLNPPLELPQPIPPNEQHKDKDKLFSLINGISSNPNEDPHHIELQQQQINYNAHYGEPVYSDGSLAVHEATQSAELKHDVLVAKQAQALEDKTVAHIPNVNGIKAGAQMEKAFMKNQFKQIETLNRNGAGDLGDIQEEQPSGPYNIDNEQQFKKDALQASKATTSPDRAIRTDYKAAVEFETQPQIRSWSFREHNMLQREHFDHQYKEFEDLDKHNATIQQPFAEEPATVRSWAENRQEMAKQKFKEQYESFENYTREMKELEKGVKPLTNSGSTYAKQYEAFEDFKNHTSNFTKEGHKEDTDETLGVYDNDKIKLPHHISNESNSKKADETENEKKVEKLSEKPRNSDEKKTGEKFKESTTKETENNENETKAEQWDENSKESLSKENASTKHDKENALKHNKEDMRKNAKLKNLDSNEEKETEDKAKNESDSYTKYVDVINDIKENDEIKQFPEKENKTKESPESGPWKELSNSTWLLPEAIKMNSSTPTNNNTQDLIKIGDDSPPVMYTNAPLGVSKSNATGTQNTNGEKTKVEDINATVMLTAKKHITTTDKILDISEKPKEIDVKQFLKNERFYPTAKVHENVVLDDDSNDVLDIFFKNKSKNHEEDPVFHKVTPVEGSKLKQISGPPNPSVTNKDEEKGNRLSFTEATKDLKESNLSEESDKLESKKGSSKYDLYKKLHEGETKLDDLKPSNIYVDNRVFIYGNVKGGSTPQLSHTIRNHNIEGEQTVERKLKIDSNPEGASEYDDAFTKSSIGNDKKNTKNARVENMESIVSDGSTDFERNTGRPFQEVKEYDKKFSLNNLLKGSNISIENHVHTTGNLKALVRTAPDEKKLLGEKPKIKTIPNSYNFIIPETKKFTAGTDSSESIGENVKHLGKFQEMNKKKVLEQAARVNLIRKQALDQDDVSMGKFSTSDLKEFEYNKGFGRAYDDLDIKQKLTRRADKRFASVPHKAKEIDDEQRNKMVNYLLSVKKEPKPFTLNQNIQDFGAIKKSSLLDTLEGKKKDGKNNSKNPENLKKIATNYTEVILNNLIEEDEPEPVKNDSSKNKTDKSQKWTTAAISLATNTTNFTGDGNTKLDGIFSNIGAGTQIKQEKKAKNNLSPINQEKLPGAGEIDNAVAVDQDAERKQIPNIEHINNLTHTIGSAMQDMLRKSQQSMGNIPGYTEKNRQTEAEAKKNREKHGGGPTKGEMQKNDQYIPPRKQAMYHNLSQITEEDHEEINEENLPDMDKRSSIRKKRSAPHISRKELLRRLKGRRTGNVQFGNIATMEIGNETVYFIYNLHGAKSRHPLSEISELFHKKRQMFREQKKDTPQQNEKSKSDISTKNVPAISSELYKLDGQPRLDLSKNLHSKYANKIVNHIQPNKNRLSTNSSDRNQTHGLVNYYGYKGPNNDLPVNKTSVLPVYTNNQVRKIKSNYSSLNLHGISLLGSKNAKSENIAQLQHSKNKIHAGNISTLHHLKNKSQAKLTSKNTQQIKNPLTKGNEHKNFMYLDAPVTTDHVDMKHKKLRLPLKGTATYYIKGWGVDDAIAATALRGNLTVIPKREKNLNTSLQLQSHDTNSNSHDQTSNIHPGDAANVYYSVIGKGLFINKSRVLDVPNQKAYNTSQPANINVSYYKPSKNSSINNRTAVVNRLNHANSDIYQNISDADKVDSRIKSNSLANNTKDSNLLNKGISNKLTVNDRGKKTKISNLFNLKTYETHRNIFNNNYSLSRKEIHLQKYATNNQKGTKASLSVSKPWPSFLVQNNTNIASSSGKKLTPGHKNIAVDSNDLSESFIFPKNSQIQVSRLRKQVINDPDISRHSSGNFKFPIRNNRKPKIPNLHDKKLNDVGEKSTRLISNQILQLETQNLNNGSNMLTDDIISNTFTNFHKKGSQQPSVDKLNQFNQPVVLHSIYPIIQKFYELRKKPKYTIKLLELLREHEQYETLTNPYHQIAKKASLLHPVNRSSEKSLAQFKRFYEKIFDHENVVSNKIRMLNFAKLKDANVWSRDQQHRLQAKSFKPVKHEGTKLATENQFIPAVKPRAQNIRNLNVDKELHFIPRKTLLNAFPEPGTANKQLLAQPNKRVMLDINKIAIPAIQAYHNFTKNHSLTIALFNGSFPQPSEEDAQLTIQTEPQNVNFGKVGSRPREFRASLLNKQGKETPVNIKKKDDIPSYDKLAMVLNMLKRKKRQDDGEDKTKHFKEEKSVVRFLIPSRIGHLQPSNLLPMPMLGHDPDESPPPPLTLEQIDAVNQEQERIREAEISQQKSLFEKLQKEGKTPDKLQPIAMDITQNQVTQGQQKLVDQNILQDQQKQDEKKVQQSQQRIDDQNTTHDLQRTNQQKPTKIPTAPGQLRLEQPISIQQLISLQQQGKEKMESPQKELIGQISQQSPSRGEKKETENQTNKTTVSEKKKNRPTEDKSEGEPEKSEKQRTGEESEEKQDSQKTAVNNTDNLQKQNTDQQTKTQQNTEQAGAEKTGNQLQLQQLAALQKQIQMLAEQQKQNMSPQQKQEQPKEQRLKEDQDKSTGLTKPKNKEVAITISSTQVKFPLSSESTAKHKEEGRQTANTTQNTESQNETQSDRKDPLKTSQKQNDPRLIPGNQETPPVGPDGKPHVDSGPQEEKVIENSAKIPKEPPANETAPSVGESGKNEVGTNTKSTSKDKKKPDVTKKEASKIKDENVDTTFEAGLQDDDKVKGENDPTNSSGEKNKQKAKSSANQENGEIDLGTSPGQENMTYDIHGGQANITTFNYPINVTILEQGILKLINQTAPKIKTVKDKAREEKEKTLKEKNKKYPELKLPTKNGEYIPPEAEEEEETAKELNVEASSKPKSPSEEKKSAPETVKGVSPPLPSTNAEKDKETSFETDYNEIIDSTPTETASLTNTNHLPATTPATPTITKEQGTEQTQIHKEAQLAEAPKKESDSNLKLTSSNDDTASKKPKKENNVVGNTSLYGAGGDAATENLSELTIPLQTDPNQIPIIPIAKDSPLGKLLYPALSDNPPPTAGSNVLQQNLPPNNQTVSPFTAPEYSEILLEQTKRLLNEGKLNRRDLFNLLQTTKKQHIQKQEIISREIPEQQMFVLFPDKNEDQRKDTDIQTKLDLPGITSDIVNIPTLTGYYKPSNDQTSEINSKIHDSPLESNTLITLPNYNAGFSVQKYNGKLVLVPHDINAISSLETRKHIPQNINLDVHYKITSTQKKDIINRLLSNALDKTNDKNKKFTIGHAT